VLGGTDKIIIDGKAGQGAPWRSCRLISCKSAKEATDPPLSQGD
jgi:hypothetical protein